MHERSDPAARATHGTGETLLATYTVTLADVDPGAAYQIRAMIWRAKDLDTTGLVFIKPGE